MSDVIRSRIYQKLDEIWEVVKVQPIRAARCPDCRGIGLIGLVYICGCYGGFITNKHSKKTLPGVRDRLHIMHHEACELASALPVCDRPSVDEWTEGWGEA